MASSLVRQFLKLFGDSGASTNFAEFGSQTAGFPVKTKDIPTIQSLAAWLEGIQSALNPSNKAPFLEDFNSLFYVMAYQLCYILQRGVPEWDSSTTYFTGDLVKGIGNAAIYGSRTDNNVNNALPSIGDANANWNTISPPHLTDCLGLLDVSQLGDNTITSAKIVSLAVAKLSGLILAAQIQSLDVSQLTGILGLASGGTGGTTRIFKATTYVGNGLNAHTVPHSLGTTPDMVVVIYQAAVNGFSPVIWASTLQSNTSRVMSGNALSDGILSADGSNITLGTNILVNGNGAGYSLFSFKSQP